MAYGCFGWEIGWRWSIFVTKLYWILDVTIDMCRVVWPNGKAIAITLWTHFIHFLFWQMAVWCFSFSGYWILRNLYETCGHCLPQTLEHQGLAEYPWTCGGLGSTSTARAGLQSLEWRYPLVIQHSYRKLPFIVDLPSKHCDFPVRKVLVYQRVYPLAIKQTMENHLHWGDVPLQRLIAGR